MGFLRGHIDRIALVACLCGWGWIAFNLNGPADRHLFPACPIKLVFGVPCPACGSTHAVIHIFEGQFSEAFQCNPLGFILAAGLVLFPLWVVFDFFRHSTSFRSFYSWFEGWFLQKKVALPAAILLVTNWVWNLLK
jgi:hypothetical protein